MEKMKGSSMDIVAENISKLKEIFPEVFCEDRIDFDRLQDILGNYIEDREERYSFEWNGKSKAIKLAQTPSTGTLRPCQGESKNWDTTQNLYLEGDNLEVLKLLQKTYHNRIKMIYIDPPYNTGNDFVYPDDYKDNLKNYLELTGQVDSEGRRISTNTEASGRYHTNWLNMMYPRLRLAKNLLADDGVIFISIDDNEVHNLKKICDEIFGEENFVADMTIVNNLKGRNDKKYIARANERLLMFVKTEQYQEQGLSIPEERIWEFNLEDEKGKYRLLGLRKRGGADTRELRPKMFFPIFVNPKTLSISLESNQEYNIQVLPYKSDGTEGCWRWGFSTVVSRINELTAKQVGNDGRYDIFEKDYLELDGEMRRIKPKSVMMGTDYSTDKATKTYRELMKNIDFNNPKPIAFLKDLIDYAVSYNDIILDFFGGSSTTAHAVMQLNAEDGGNRKFIMVQLPEPTDEKSEAHRAGYKNICEIGKERIRRAGEKILEENKDKEGIENLDIGFKVFKLDASNLKKWNPDYDEIDSYMDIMVDNFVKGRNQEDLLYEIMLKYGIDFTYPVDIREISGKKVFSIGFGALLVCLDDDITLEVVEGIVKLRDELSPEITRVVFKDNGFKSDSVKTNVLQILKRNKIEEVMSI